MHAGLEMAVADDGVLGKAGDEEHLQIGAGHTCSVGHLAAVHRPGQADVGHQKIDPGIGLEHSKSGWAVDGLDGTIAKILQRFGHQHPNAGLIVDHQNRFSLLGARRVSQAPFVLDIGGRTKVTGQVDAHHRTAADLRVDTDMPA